jgi:ATP-dependent Clp protease adaptor protein ClpS
MSKYRDPDSMNDRDVKLDPDTVLQEPKMYRVILHNDHYTTMEFVVEVLILVFHKPAAEATKIMLDVHKKGAGACGVYTYDIAATKLREFPLKCSLEEA